MYKMDYEWPDWVVPTATQGPIGRGESGEERGEGGGSVVQE